MIDRDGDPFLERCWRQLYLVGEPAGPLSRETALAALTVYEQLELIAPAAAERWRARFANQDDARIDAGTALDGTSCRLGEEYLADRLERLRQALRVAGSGSGERWEFLGAVRALSAVGAIDAAARERWVRAAQNLRVLADQGLWQDEDDEWVETEDPAIAVNAIAPEATDAEQDEFSDADSYPSATRVLRVVPGSFERHGRLAIIALVVHEDAVGLHFHYLGDTEQEALARQAATGDFWSGGPAAPVLRDDQGTVYTTVYDGFASGSGTGPSSPLDRESFIGHWVYRPAPPDPHVTFLVERDEHVWRLPP